MVSVLNGDEDKISWRINQAVVAANAKQ